MISDIPRSSLFHTPESTYELDLMIKNLTRAEQAIAYQYTMLAFNLAHKLAKQEETENA